MQNEIKLQVGVKALLKNEEWKYLLLRRSLEKYPEMDGAWDIPGGRINPGTNLLENLKREIKEETGLELKGYPKLIAAQDILRLPERHIVRLTYIGETFGEVFLDKVEHDEYRWCSLDDLKKVENIDVLLEEIIDKVLNI